MDLDTTATYAFYGINRYSFYKGRGVCLLSGTHRDDIMFKMLNFSSYRSNISPESDNQIACSQREMQFKKLEISI